MMAFALCSFAQTSFASSDRFSHGATAEEIQKAVLSNQQFHRREKQITAAPFRPVEDTANFAYVLMSEDEEGMDEITNLRKTIAQNLPEGVKLVILANTADADQVREEYQPWISSDRLIIATDTSTENGLWARDSFPIPVYDNAQKQASLVAAHYYRDFSSWDAVAQSVGAQVVKEDFTFVGGNLIADEDGNCFSVDSYRRFTITQDDLAQAYGCKTAHLMAHVRGLGDVDEVLKPLPGKRILTNSPEYKADLESWGYQVILLPTSPEQYRTYVNSLIVRDTVFMPVYNVAQDDDARKVYESLGYKVFPVTSISMSDDLNGSVHCQTMAYPPMPESGLLKALHAKKYGF
jgi:hypothetical protein